MQAFELSILFQFYKKFKTVIQEYYLTHSIVTSLVLSQMFNSKTLLSACRGYLETKTKNKDYVKQNDKI